MILGVAALLAAAAALTAPARTLDDCDALVRPAPRGLDAHRCYWLVARRAKVWDDAARRLDARLSLDPGNPAAALYLGLIEADRRRTRSLELFERAAAGFERAGEPTGEVYARISIAYYRQSHGDLDAADEALARARLVSERAADPLLLTRMDFEGSRQANLRAEYAAALALGSRADAAMPAHAPPDLRSGVLATLGMSSWALGRHRDSMRYFERQAEYLHGVGDLWLESQARSNVAVLAGELMADDAATVEEWRSLVHLALATALAAANPWVEKDVRLLLAQDPSLSLDRRIAEVERTLGGDDKPSRIAAAHRELARLRLERDPDRPEAAEAELLKAEALAEASGQPLEIALAAIARMNFRWRVGPRELAVRDTFAALDAIERIRGLQRGDLARARWLSEQSIHYARAVSHVLGSDAPTPSRATLETAFEVVERLRARVLLDAPESSSADRAAIVSRLTALQKRLLDPALEEAIRRSILAEIERLEPQEAASGTSEVIARPALATIAEVAKHLAEDEALLSYQLSGRGADASWVFVVTRHDAFAQELPEGDRLPADVDVFLGALERRDGLERTLAPRLHERVLGPALRRLPPEVRRLVIVPDGALHRLPFDILAPSRDDPPVAERFELSIAPSATLWARSRGATRGNATQALALSDPALVAPRPTAAERQSAPWVEGLRPGPLPNARVETRRLSNLLGGRGRVLEGSEASERALKAAVLDPFAMIVFATHAVIDEDRPDRSAVLLAAGAPDEDGLLQPREVATLPLTGKLVVLSSCGSATGAVLRGEGVAGLSRSFFRAGAGAVVGTLWPTRDDEAAALAGALYDHLARGESVGAALAAARRERRKAGAPAAAWAAFVVLGDANLTPFPGGVPARRGAWLPWVGAGVLLASTLAARWWGRRRNRGGKTRPRSSSKPGEVGHADA